MPTKLPTEYRAFTITHKGRANRIVTDVQLSAAFDPAKYPDGKFPHMPIAKKALWDTGATHTVITPGIVQDLKLLPIGIANVTHAGGTSQSNRYLLNLGLPNGVGIAGVPATESIGIVGTGFDVIIGMDIITEGDFAVTNLDRITWMSFCYPSIRSISFVWQIERMTYAGTDKYGPCPCGKKDANGRPVKFKFCHGIDL